MALISKTIAGFYNGISQQPASLRLDTQCEEEINGWSSLADGTIKRPPTEHVAVLTSKASQDSFVHTINRDSTEKYTCVFTGDVTEPLEIFKTNGTKCTVRYGLLNDSLEFTSDVYAKHYITSFDSGLPDDSLRAITVNDYTLIANNKIIPGMNGTISQGMSTNRALVYVKQGVADTAYSININGQRISYFKTDVSTNYQSYTIDNILNNLISNVSQPTKAYYMGTGSRTKFNAQSNSGIVVKVNGVTKTLNVDYTITNGTEVNFVTPPSGGDKKYINIYPSWTADGFSYWHWIESGTPIPLDSNGNVDKTRFAVLFNGVPQPINTWFIGQEYPPPSWNPSWYTIRCDFYDIGGVTFQAPPAGTVVQFVYYNGAYVTPADQIEITSDLALGNYDFYRASENWLQITRKDGGDFEIAAYDTWNNQAIASIKNKVQKFQDLPASAPDGYQVEIEGDSTTFYDNYFVQYVSATKTWKETVAPYQRNSIEYWSMPHRLVRTNVDEFTFAPITWSNRLVGSIYTNPEPSFIGKPINDIFFYKNRLGILAGENLCLSKSGDFFNFFSQTVTSTLDDDPIDVAVSTNEVATLYHAQPFNSELILFSDQMQFVVNSNNQNFTAKTVAIDMSTHFATDKNCKPVAAGANIFFVSPRGSNTSIKEYFIQPNTTTNDAADITAHVPRLLPQNVSKLVSSSTLDTLFVHSKDTPSKLYVYRYYWSGDQKAQSSWSVWEFDNDIINFDIIDTKLQLLIERGKTGSQYSSQNDSEVILEALELNKINTGSLPFRVHLDRLKAVRGVYNSSTGLTTWTLPYKEFNAVENVFSGYVTNMNLVNSVNGTTLPNISTITTLPMTSPAYVSALTSEGNYSDVDYYVGRKYEHSYTFSEQFIKAPNSNTGLLQGRLQLKSLSLNFTNTGYFQLQVTPFNRDTTTHEYNASLVGVSELGVPAITSETRRFLLMCNSKGSTIKLVNDSYLPSEFHSASFEAQFTTRNQAV